MHYISTVTDRFCMYMWVKLLLIKIKLMTVLLLSPKIHKLSPLRGFCMYMFKPSKVSKRSSLRKVKNRKQQR